MMRCTRKRLLGELFASVWLKRRNQIREGRIIQETEGTIAVTEEAGITTIGETIIEEEDMAAAETGIVIEGTIADTTGEMVDIIAENPFLEFAEGLAHGRLTRWELFLWICTSIAFIFISSVILDIYFNPPQA